MRNEMPAWPMFGPVHAFIAAHAPSIAMCICILTKCVYLLNVYICILTICVCIYICILTICVCIYMYTHYMCIYVYMLLYKHVPASHRNYRRLLTNAVLV